MGYKNYQNLTLTRVVFEYVEAPATVTAGQNLTLTRVVFEWQ